MIDVTARLWPSRYAALLATSVAMLFLAPIERPAAAEHIKIGVVRSLGGAPVFIAKEKGFFDAEGLDAELVLFDAAQPIAVAATSGDIDFGTTGMTAAFFTLASQGVLKLIGAGTWEHPGFQSIGFLVSNQAYAAGLKSFKDIGGRSAAITQLGTPLHYNLGRVVEKYGVDLKTVRVLALQSNSNVASALTGGQADVAVQTAANAYPLVQRGDARMLGWVGDELPPGQSEGTFTATKLANERPETVKHFLTAIRKGERTWDEAFTDASGKRQDQATAPEMIAIAAKVLGQPPEIVKLGIAYYDPQSRISLSDVRRIVDWYKAQNMLKGDINVDALVDTRYAILASDH
jgi:NitT/TauT family transport system substrate-binding protein